MFVPELLASVGQQSVQQNPITQFIPFVLVFLVFYFLIIRPQQKKVKQQKEMIGNLKKGDQVITNFGVYGTINKVLDNKDHVLLDIADKTTIKIQKAHISEILEK